MRHQLAPQIEHGALPGPLHQVGLRKIEHKTQHHNREIEELPVGSARSARRWKATRSALEKSSAHA